MPESVFTTYAFHCPKEGGTLEEYEDAYSFRATSKGHRVAIADGATESSFSQLWARLLVESYTRSRALGPSFFYKLKAARKLWRKSIKKKPLAWYAKEKADMGAFSAFLGLELDGGSKRWSAIAMGDCNLFHLDTTRRGFRLLHAFPLTHSEQFGMGPFLLGTGTRDDELEPNIKIATGFLREGDTLLLASDALSAWLLNKDENGKGLWEMMCGITNQQKFEYLVQLARSRGLHNDDTTMVRLTFNGEET